MLSSIRSGFAISDTNTRNFAFGPNLRTLCDSWLGSATVAIPAFDERPRAIAVVGGAWSNSLRCAATMVRQTRQRSARSYYRSEKLSLEHSRESATALGIAQQTIFVLLPRPRIAGPIFPDPQLS